jgi:hypothetical protein
MSINRPRSRRRNGVATPLALIAEGTRSDSADQTANTPDRGRGRRRMTWRVAGVVGNWPLKTP